MGNIDPICTLSRHLSRRLLGRQEMICAWLDWRQKTAIVIPINWVFFCLRGEIGHCRNMAHWEERQQAALPQSSVDRARRAGM